jgi:hypothetical protein
MLGAGAAADPGSEITTVTGETGAAAGRGAGVSPDAAEPAGGDPLGAAADPLDAETGPLDADEVPPDDALPLGPAPAPPDVGVVPPEAGADPLAAGVAPLDTAVGPLVAEYDPDGAIPPEIVTEPGAACAG